MKEIEVKILEVPVEKTQKYLESIGAKKVFDSYMDIVYLDTPQKTLQSQKKLLRLRTKGDKAELTFKKVIRVSDVKEMSELNIEIDSLKYHLDVFVELGYVVTKRMRKKRVSYALNDMSFEFDTLPHIPTFLEIEAQCVEDIYYWVEKLGFTKNDMKSWSMSDVEHHYAHLLKNKC
ncbi:MAG: class IV adenylate cyclase [Candidatus Woesearchaeota archaeon]